MRSINNNGAYVDAGCSDLSDISLIFADFAHKSSMTDSLVDNGTYEDDYSVDFGGRNFHLLLFYVIEFLVIVGFFLGSFIHYHYKHKDRYERSGYVRQVYANLQSEKDTRPGNPGAQPGGWENAVHPTIAISPGDGDEEEPTCSRRSNLEEVQQLLYFLSINIDTLCMYFFKFRPHKTRSSSVYERVRLFIYFGLFRFGTRGISNKKRDVG